MNKDEILDYLEKRLSELKKRKSILRDVRSKNKGKIEELEDLIQKIGSGSLKEYSDE
ncbi:hypothetical protein ACF3MZ_11010 [Paenibacillaceae bacterium WGS1546]|uniref:hypothetical protein n=1 Tax=Cohnella sp. WGS1546 TaxID=3366810 RepID=UPI00372D4752